MQQERHYIMQVVCEATQCNCVAIQVAALQNLVRIMSLYYAHMEAYMGPALFAVRRGRMRDRSIKGMGESDHEVQGLLKILPFGAL